MSLYTSSTYKMTKEDTESVYTSWYKTKDREAVTAITASSTTYQTAFQTSYSYTSTYLVTSKNMTRTNSSTTGVINDVVPYYNNTVITRGVLI